MGSVEIPAPTQNNLLSALPFDQQARLHDQLEFVAFNLGDIIHESREHLDYLYFPTSCVVSLVYTTAGGVTAEMGLVGNDGALGIEILMGGESMPHRAIVQVAGCAFKMQAKLLREEFASNHALQQLMLRYTQALITQVSQTAVCNRLHSVEQRLCRWILMCHDRLHADELLMTQEFIANMLGARRQGVTAAAGRLQGAGLIHFSRGHIKILDRPGLERTVCECYPVVKKEFDRLIGLPQSRH